MVLVSYRASVSQTWVLGYGHAIQLLEKSLAKF